MSELQGLHWVDVAVVVVYFAGVTAIGLWMARRVRNLSEFFMPRRFGKGMMMMHAFGTGTASDQAVTVASATFRNGLSGIWYQWLWLCVTPFYWLIAPIFRRFRAVTTADVYELRFNGSVGVLFALVGMAGLAVKIGLMLKGAGALIESGTGAMIDTDLAIIALTVLFVVYGAAGGLAAAIVTDSIQGILTVIFSVMLLPFIFSAVGGMEGVRRTITDPAMLSLVAPGKITAFFVVMMSIQALLAIVALPSTMGICSAGRTEWEGRVGMLGGNIIKRLCTIAWCLTAIAAVAWYLRRGVDLSEIDPDFVYGNVAQAFLPSLLPGLLGLFLAALLAGVMSSCDSFMISSAGLFTKNIYTRLVEGRSDGHYLWVGRAASLVVVGAGVVFAYRVPGVVRALEIWFSVTAMMGIVFWMALFWRRMTPAGAWATTLTGFAAWWVSTRSWFIDWAADLPVAGPLGLIWMNDGEAELHQPWTILFYLTSAIGAGILVSLATRPVPAEQLDRFHALMRTPVRPGEQIERPCTLPEGTPPADRRLLVSRFGLEVPMPSRTSVAGFLVGWGLVALIVGGFVLVVR